ncbi:MAG: tetratricopeptide repeat protein [Chloroflexi bacterium]|nr:tetratricopeptide repeat protein [Chloroflexota bacterium]
MHRVVPELILENYRTGRFSGGFPAVGMFLDLSGFSKMTDALMQHGQHGAEVLAGLMHGVFDPLVRSIFEYGGRIVSFAGDGIMALFPIDGDERDMALRALASAWTIQRRLTENPHRDTVYGRFSFSVKIGLTVGFVSWRILRSSGGNQATYYFRGSAVDDAAAAEHQAGAGEIVLTAHLHAVIGDAVQTFPQGSFWRFVRFLGEIPGTTACFLPSVDVASSKVFMPETVIVHDIRGEFRQIVNLFMRIPDLPDEKLEEFINSVFVLRKQYGGLLTRLDFGDKGCNLLMLWGAPVAYENDIGRALNFVLDLQARVDFPITVGVTYYIAHAGYLGSEMCEDYTCYGWGVNLASRFMMSAQTGHIWVDERVARRVSQSFDIEYIGSQSFKGFAAAQKVYRLLRRKQNVDAVYQGEMVGRQAELSRLVEFVEPLWRGKFSGVVGVAGDAGIGKGRLIHAFRTSPLFMERAALWAVCQADQILRQSFNPLRRWLYRYFGFLADQSLEERKAIFDQKIDQLLASLPDPELARELNRMRSILGALLDLNWANSLYEQLDAEGRYNNTFIALIALIKAESLRQPVLLFVDDLHFVDLDTITFLSQLKRSLSTAENYPVAIVLAYRKTGTDFKTGDDLSDLTIELQGISEDDIAHLVEIVLGGPASPVLIELVASRSEGNPYFAEQIIRYLQQEQLLEMSNAGWQQARRGRFSVLPEDISALLIARLDQLKQEVKIAVQTASVLGREFEVQVLAYMLGSEVDTEECVAEAEKAVIWLPLREMRYIFYHALLRDAAYSMQMRARRQELHALAFTALEKVYADGLENRYAELAYHAEHGDLREKAQEYYTLAGRRSVRLYRNSEALDYINRALAYTSFEDIPARFDLVLERVELYSRIGKRDLQLRDIELLEGWGREANNGDWIGQALVLRSLYYHTTGQFLETVECTQEAKGYVSVERFPEQAVKIYNLSASSLLRLGRTEEATRQALTGLALARSLRRTADEARMLNVMGLIALEQKDPGMAHQYLETSLILAREIKDRRLESYTINNLALSEGAVRGNYVLAGEYYLRAYTIAQEIGDRYQEGIVLTNLGFVAGMRGDLSTAFQYYEQSLVVAREVGNLNLETYTLINLSAISCVTHEPERSVELAEKALEISRRVGDLSAQAWAHLYIGHALTAMKKYPQAREAFNLSANIRAELGQPSLSMEPLAGLVEASAHAGDLSAAWQYAERILAYLEGGGTLEGTDEPLRVYYACYAFLARQRDPRAGRVLQSAMQLLDAQASKFRDAESRRLFIENFPWRKALFDAARESRES